jgi:acyl-CoA synthetase (AMP-forming)/AMP-acid ligase II
LDQQLDRNFIRQRFLVREIIVCGLNGDRAGLPIDNRTEWLEACFGVVIAGATVAAFSTWSTRDERRWLIGDSGISSSISPLAFSPSWAATAARSPPRRFYESRSNTMRPKVQPSVVGGAIRPVIASRVRRGTESRDAGFLVQDRG